MCCVRVCAHVHANTLFMHVQIEVVIDTNIITCDTKVATSIVPHTSAQISHMKSEEHKKLPVFSCHRSASKWLH